MEKEIIISEQDNSIRLMLPASLYPLDVIYTASYVYLDRAYIFLKGDPKKDIEIVLKPKESMDKEGLRGFAGEFCNQLINYGRQLHISRDSIEIKKRLLQEIFAFATPFEDTDQRQKDEETEDGQEIDDPEGILIPWEEKYGKQSAKKD